MIRLFAAFAFVLCVVASLRIAHGRTLRGVNAAIFSLAPAYVDRDVPPEVKRAQLEAVAVAIERADRGQTVRAMLVAWGDAESKFALDVHRGNCRKPQCDWHPKLGFRARGPWQNWKLHLSDADWARMIGVENVQFQADEAARRVRSALALCGGSVRGAFVSLAGRPCNATIRGIDGRMKAFERARGML